MKRHLFWIVYTAFVAVVLSVHWHDNLFTTHTPFGGGKYAFWLTFLGFSAYTIQCSVTEDFFKSLRKILGFRWGKQIGSDLSIGLLIFAFIVYLHSGSALTAFLWLIPFICFGNLAALLYFAIHYDAIVALFLK